MVQLSFLDELEAMISTGEIKLLEGKEKALEMLVDIRMLAVQELCQEVIRDITDPQTSYYAPEFDSWQEFLVYCNGYEDYAEVLKTQFTQERLENMWQCSHIADELSEKEIEKEIITQISQLKMLDILNRMSAPEDPEQKLKTMEGIKARITGLYNILFE